MKEVKNLSKIVIVGAGFAGISAAISAKNNKNEIILLEKRNVVGKKILVTGNGRCNYYNDFQNDNCYHSSNDNFTKNLKDEAHIVRDFYSDLGIIPYIKDGYYYPYSKEASSIRNVLIRKCESLGIKIITSYTVNSIKKDDNKFIINDDITCDKVILATGSMAYYKDDEQLIGYDIAKSFGHNIIKCLPSLVQLKGKGNFFKKWA
jgi:predicted Rossmann fold flavoprotein